MRIGLLSDTHGFLNSHLYDHFAECDEIWHAGDIGDWQIVADLQAFKPLRAVYGNIDGPDIRHQLPEDLRFQCAGLDVFLTHIGGYPGRYNARVRALLQAHPPGLFVCGHSHILKVMPDPKLGLLHINPGAAGHHGFHHLCTAVRFSILHGRVTDLEVIEMGLRGS